MKKLVISLVLGLSFLVGGSAAMVIAKCPAPANHPNRLALGATPEGDQYSLSLLSGELTLREVGWDFRNLGPNLPMDSLAKAVKAYRPPLVFLSVSHLSDSASFLQEYGRFYETAAALGAAVVIGGRALDPELRSKLMYTGFGDRMVNLAEFGRRLLPPDLHLENPALAAI